MTYGAEITLPIPKDVKRCRIIEIAINCTEADEPIVNYILDAFIHKEWIKIKRKWRNADEVVHGKKVNIKMKFGIE